MFSSFASGFFSWGFQRITADKKRLSLDPGDKEMHKHSVFQDPLAFIFILNFCGEFILKGIYNVVFWVDEGKIVYSSFSS